MFAVINPRRGVLAIVTAVMVLAGGADRAAGEGATAVAPPPIGPGAAALVPEAAPSLEPAAIGAPSTFVPVTPERIVDTRSALGGTQGPIGAEATIDFAVTNVGGVPAGATSVVLNVTAVNPQTTGFLTVFPTGAARPDASNLNFFGGKTVANLVIARVGAGGKVSVYNFGGGVDVLFDVTGYFVAGTTAGRFFPLPPFRIHDSRRNPSPSGAVAPLGPGGVLPLVANNQIPAAHFSAVLVNVTVTNTTGGGYLTLYPTGSSLPTSSNVNFAAGQTVANAVIVKIGPAPNNGAGINIFNAFGTTDVVVDLLGVFDDGVTPLGVTSPTAFRALEQPERIFSTRVSGGPFGPAQVRTANVAGAGGAPAGARAVVLNATVAATTAPSYLSVWPAGLLRPNDGSSVNWAAGDTVPNFVGVALPFAGPTAGQLSLYNDAGSAEVLLDVSGYFYPV